MTSDPVIVSRSAVAATSTSEAASCSSSMGSTMHPGCRRRGLFYTGVISAKELEEERGTTTKSHYLAFPKILLAAVFLFLSVNLAESRKWTIDDLYSLRFPYQTSNDLYLDVCKAGKRHVTSRARLYVHICASSFILFLLPSLPSYLSYLFALAIKGRM